MRDNSNLFMFLLQDNINILKKIFDLKIADKIDDVSDLINNFNENNKALNILKEKMKESE